MLRSGELYRFGRMDVAFYDEDAISLLGYTETGKHANATVMVVVEICVAVAAMQGCGRAICEGDRPQPIFVAWSQICG